MATSTNPNTSMKKEYWKAIKMAIWYLLGKKRTYKMVGEKFGMKPYEVSKYLNYLLPNASPWLNKKVRAKAAAAKASAAFKSKK